MASAGRILIMPKGEWDANTEYEMLDLVFRNGRSWLARKNSVGIEPSDANAEHWFKMCESVDLTDVYNRISAIENQMLSTLSLDDIDLSGYATKVELANYTPKSEMTNYATKSELTNYSTKTELSSNIGNVNNSINGLLGRVGALEPNVASLMASMASINGAKYSIGSLTPPDTSQIVTIPCSFAPKAIFVIGTPSSTIEWFSLTMIIPENGVGVTLAQLGNLTLSDFQVTKNGNDTVIQYVRTSNTNNAPSYICNNASMKYSYICIG